ncbi:MAG TPA: O-antigen ligase family protein [Pirellulales bacterium]|nr:O-antigen ligase family protein [Pirellulales bacterium]
MEFILGIGALAAMCWAGVIFLRGGLVGGALLVLLAGTCFGHPFFNVPLGPFPLTLDRVLLGALAVQCLLLRRWGRVELPRLTSSDYLLAALLALLVVSALTHDFRFRKGLPLSQLAFFYMVPAMMYAIMRHATWSERSVQWLLGSLAAFGVYLALTAIAESHQASGLVFPSYIASGAVVEFLGRGRGPLLNPSGNGILLALTISATLAWWPWLHWRGKWFVLALMPLVAWGVYSTLTRSAWMGAALSVVVVGGLSTPRRWRAIVLCGACAIGAIATAASWEHFVAFKRDQYVSAEETAESARLRPILAVVAWHMFLDRPLFGCGYGQYIQESPAYLADRTTELPLEKARPFIQHNAFLSLLTETGLVGMSLLIALLVFWTRSAWRLWRRSASPLWAQQVGLLYLGFLAAYLMNAMFQDVSIIPMINMILFFLGGTVTTLESRLTHSAGPSQTRLNDVEPELIGTS